MAKYQVACAGSKIPSARGGSPRRGTRDARRAKAAVAGLGTSYSLPGERKRRFGASDAARAFAVALYVVALALSGLTCAVYEPGAFEVEPVWGASRWAVLGTLVSVGIVSGSCMAVSSLWRRGN